MTKIKVLKAKRNDQQFNIVEESNSLGWYAFVFDKYGTCIRSNFYNQLESALESAETEYNVSSNEWHESNEKSHFTIQRDRSSNVIDNPLPFSIIPYGFRAAPIIIWFSFLLVGVLNNAMNWPLGISLILLTSAGLTAWAISDAIFLKGTNWIINTLIIIGIIWLLVMLWGIFFNEGLPTNTDGLILYLVTFSIYSLIYYFIKKDKTDRIFKSLY